MTPGEQIAFGVGERAWELGPEFAIGLVHGNVTMGGSGQPGAGMRNVGGCFGTGADCRGDSRFDGTRILDELNQANPLYVGAIDVVKGADAQEKGDYVALGRAGMGLFGTIVMTAVTLKVGGGRKVPNPNGRRGGVAHQAMVAEVKASIKERGLDYDVEYRVDTPNGSKSRRYVDVVALAGKQVVEMHQIGKQNLGLRPVAREIKAMNDIEMASGTRPSFHPYNKGE